MLWLHIFQFMVVKFANDSQTHFFGKIEIIIAMFWERVRLWIIRSAMTDDRLISFIGLLFVPFTCSLNTLHHCSFYTTFNITGLTWISRQVDVTMSAKVDNIVRDENKISEYISNIFSERNIVFRNHRLYVHLRTFVTEKGLNTIFWYPESDRLFMIKIFSKETV